MKPLLIFSTCLALFTACSKDQDAPPAFAATTKTYAVRGWRYETFAQNTSRSSRLRDSVLTVVRHRPDSLHINGFSGTRTTSDPGFPRISATDPTVFSVSAPAGDITFLALYAAGDSLQLRQFSRIGHAYTRTDSYGGPRRP